MALRQATRAPHLRSPACYALKALKNARLHGGRLAPTDSASGLFRSSQSENTRAKAVKALYEALSSSLNGTNWHLGWTRTKPLRSLPRAFTTRLTSQPWLASWTSWKKMEVLPRGGPHCSSELTKSAPQVRERGGLGVFVSLAFSQLAFRPMVRMRSFRFQISSNSPMRAVVAADLATPEILITQSLGV